MLTIKTIPTLLKIVAKLDIKPVVEMLKKLDIFEEAKDTEDAILQLSREKVGLLACEIFAEITPQLGKIADDLPPLVASYYDISIEEAEKRDAAEVINDFINDEGIVSFFKRALRKNVEQKA
jgi:hypothetical protein